MTGVTAESYLGLRSFRAIAQERPPTKLLGAKNSLSTKLMVSAATIYAFRPAKTKARVSSPARSITKLRDYPITNLLPFTFS